MTDSVTKKLTDLAIKSNEASRNKLTTPPSTNNNLEDKNNPNPWKTSNQKSLEKPVLENDWPNLQSQSDNKHDNNRRSDEKQSKKNFNKWNHLEVETNKYSGNNAGRGRFSGPVQSSSNSYNAISSSGRPKRGSMYMGRNRMVSERGGGRNNGYNSRSQARNLNRPEEEQNSQDLEVKKESELEEKKRNEFTDVKYDEDDSDRPNRRSNPSSNKDKPAHSHKKHPNQEELSIGINRGVNIVSTPQIIPSTFIIPTVDIQPTSAAVFPTQPIPIQNPVVPEIFYGQIPTEHMVDRNIANSMYDNTSANQNDNEITPKVIDAEELINLCKEIGWDKVVFPKALREADNLADKIPKDLQDNEVKDANEPIKGNVVIIIDKRFYIVPKFKYKTMFLKFNSKIEFIGYHLNYYFSERNLYSDGHLKTIISENKNSCPFSDLLQFNRLKSITTTENELKEAAQLCSSIEIISGPDNKPAIVPKIRMKPLYGDPQTPMESPYPNNNSQSLIPSPNDERSYQGNGDQIQISQFGPITRNESAGNFDGVSQTFTNVQAPSNLVNSAPIMYSLISPNQGPNNYISNPNPAFLQHNQQMQNSLPSNMNTAVSASGQFFPIQALGNYYPYIQQPTASNYTNPNIIQTQTQPSQNQPNNTSQQQGNPAPQQSPQQQPGNPQSTPFLSYLPNHNQPFHVLSTFSQPHPYFNNQSMSSNPNHSVANIQNAAHFGRFNHMANLHQGPGTAGAAATGPNANQQQITNQNMQNLLFHFISPPNHLTNVFHPSQQDSVHAFFNRNAAIINPSIPSLIMPLAGQHGMPAPGHHVIPHNYQVIPQPVPIPAQDASNTNNNNRMAAGNPPVNQQHPNPAIYPPNNSRKSPSVQQKLDKNNFDLSSSTSQNPNESFSKD